MRAIIVVHFRICACTCMALCVRRRSSQTPRAAAENTKRRAISGENRVTHPLVNVVRTKLHSRVWYNTYAICSIAGHESSPAFLLHIFASALGTDILYSSRPTLWTWNRILRRSRGETTVRETAPATPPATKEASTGCAKTSLNFWSLVGSGVLRGWNCSVS